MALLTFVAFATSALDEIGMMDAPNIQPHHARRRCAFVTSGSPSQVTRADLHGNVTDETISRAHPQRGPNPYD
jgi:hypothetical protein